MNIDWAATGNWMQAWAGFAQAGVVGYVAYKSADALKSWKRQKVAERKFDAAERIITLAYRLRRSFSVVRSGIMWGGELAAAEAQLRETSEWLNGLTEEKRKSTIYAQAILRRINSYKVEWEELLAAMPIARAYFGLELEQKLELVFQQRGIVSAAAEMYADDDDRDREFTRKLQRDLWEGYGGVDNEVTKTLKLALNRIEEILQPILSETVN